jgi:hypothetical protein
MQRRIWVAVLLVACSGKKAGKPPEAAKDAAAAVAAKDADAKDGGAAAEQKKAVLPRDQVDAIMKKWLEAQNSGDFAAYSALYDEAFHGVRRSGKQKVELDRKGWLADRKKMFAKPMLVGMRDVEVTLAPTKASVRFTQEWSSGSYHDLGPKVIEVESRAGALLITGEEMLASRLVKPAKVAAGTLPPVLPTLDRNTIVLTGDVEARWGSGAPRLIAGEIPDRDPSCDDDPPDYEQDQTRYWECQASDLNGGYAHFVAEQDIDVGALPAAFAAWIGKSVRLSGVGAGCTATVNRLQLRAGLHHLLGDRRRGARQAARRR